MSKVVTSSIVLGSKLDENVSIKLKEIKTKEDVENNNEGKNEASQDLQGYHVPDGGWGWACVLGCSIVHFFIGGYPRSFGLIYQQLLKDYHSSAALTAWIGGAFGAVRMELSPIANFLARKYGARKIVFIGGLIYALGNMLTYFAKSTEFFFVSYSIIAGTGAALVYSPSLVVVGQYFKTKRSKAISLATCGSGIGAFVLPPMMLYLFSNCGFSTGLLILGALHMSCCISGLLYRPLKPMEVVTEKKIECKSVSLTIEAPKDEKIVKDEKSKQVVVGEVKDARETVKRNAISQALSSVASCLDISVWRDERFTLYAISQGLSVMSYLPVSTFIPSITEEKGISHNHAVLILSLMALGDTTGRLCSGFIFDLKIFAKHRYVPFSICMTSCSIFLLIWPYLYSLKYILINSILFGLIIGVTIAQRTTILCDLVGTARLYGYHGMLVFAQGVAVFIGPLIGGRLRDVFGNYTYTFMYMSVLMFFAGVFSLAAGIMAKRRISRRLNKKISGDN